MQDEIETGFQPQSKDELQTAVDLWIDDNATALNTYGEINDWDVSLITDMSSLFQSKSTFNDDIGNWNVSNVTNMQSMFSVAREFNQNLSEWDVSNVTNMQSMFRETKISVGLAGWDVSNVTNMVAMFHGATIFNEAIGYWNVSNVTNMSEMFKSAWQFNQDIGSWDVSNVTHFNTMFYHANSFNSDLSEWNVSTAESMNAMFRQCNFNQDLANWDVSNVANFGSMFHENWDYNHNLSSWDVSSATSMQNMFFNTSYNHDLSSWEIPSGCQLGGMFNGNTSLSEENQCAIHTTFSSNNTWNYDWSSTCAVLGCTDVDASNYNADATLDDGSCCVNLWDTCYNIESTNTLDLVGSNLTGGIPNEIGELTNLTFINLGGNDLTGQIPTTIGNLTGLTHLLMWGNQLSESIPAEIGNITNLSVLDLNNNLLSGAVPTEIGNLTNLTELYLNINQLTGELPSSLSNLINLNILNLSVNQLEGSVLSSFCNINELVLDGNEFCSIIPDCFNGNIGEQDCAVLGCTDSEACNYNADATDDDGSCTFAEANFDCDGNCTAEIDCASNCGGDAVVDECGVCDNDATNDCVQDCAGTWGGTLVYDECGACGGDGPAEHFTCTGFKPTTKEALETAVDLWTCSSNSDDCDNELALATYGHISEWDVSLITDMSDLFFTRSTFNDDIGNWDVSNVTSMYRMLYEAHEFNHDLSSWDVSNVTNMSGMLRGTSYSGDLSSWDVSSVTDMSSMFAGATSFNGDVSSWDVSNVTNMSGMFTSATSFNSDISSWDVSNVTNMQGVFRGTSYSGDISSWNVSNVTEMHNMFGWFNGTVDISSWDVSSVTNMHRMFCESNFNGDISGWTTSSLTNTSEMFSGNTVFNGDINGWDVSNVTTMIYMFLGATSFNQDLNSWDVSNGPDMYKLFSGASSFNGDVSDWDVSNVTIFLSMFAYTSFNGDLSNWDVSNAINFNSMLRNTPFNGDISGWDVSSATQIHTMFSGATSFNQDISGWDVSNVGYIGDMFSGATSFNQDLSSWDVSNVIHMNNVFHNTIALSDANRCLINSTWSSNNLWPYDWSDLCAVLGCTDIGACNYNADATDDDGGCTFAEANFDCDNNCLFETDCTGECGGSAEMLEYWSDNDGDGLGFVTDADFALSFNGSNYVQIQNNSNLNINGDITMTAWIKPSQFPGMMEIMTNDDEWYFEIRDRGLWFEKHSGMALTGCTNCLEENTWSHVAVVRNQSSLRMYLDGNQIASGTISGNFGNISYGYYLGVHGHDGHGKYHGEMDEVSLWNRGLSASEIQSAMNNGLNGNESGLVTYYDFNEGNGNTLTDLNDNGNDGDIFEASWIVNENGDGTTSFCDANVPNGWVTNSDDEDDDCFSNEHDCLGLCDGSATLDNCNTCDNDSSNDCVQDCAGEWDGDAIIDYCENCNTETPSELMTSIIWTDVDWHNQEGFSGNFVHVPCDVAWEQISITLDDESNTPVWIKLTAENDMSADFQVEYAYVRNELSCGFYIYGNINEQAGASVMVESSYINLNLLNTACPMDCAGEWSGDAIEDNCGVCDNDTSNNCNQDCSNVWGGDAVLDNCNTCDADASNDCTQDCAGEWGGALENDECGICDGDGSSCAVFGCTLMSACNFDENATMNDGTCFYAEENYDCNGNCTVDLDCAGTCAGDAVEDNCGTCDNDATNNCIQDCVGTWGGDIVEDECGVCFGDGWSCSPVGDVNKDYSVDISDIIIIINYILGENTLEGYALINADWNVNGEVNLVDIVNIINIILGENLSKGESPTFINVLYNNDYISINTNGKVGGIQIEYNGNLEIKESYLPSDWLISYNDHTLLFYSIDGSELNESKLVDIFGDIEILSAFGVGRNGEKLTAGVSILPTEYILHPAYPNPFNPVTHFNYELPFDSEISLVVYDIEGKKVKTLVENLQLAGSYSAEWNAEGVSTGIYFVKLISNDNIQVHKLMLVK